MVASNNYQYLTLAKVLAGYNDDISHSRGQIAGRKRQTLPFATPNPASFWKASPHLA